MSAPWRHVTRCLVAGVVALLPIGGTVLGVAYVAASVLVALFHSHRMLGPVVPLRRHVEALKNGDYASRIQLRKRDAHGELADDLNELASLLASREKQNA